MLTIPGYAITELIDENRHYALYRGALDPDEQGMTFLFRVIKESSLNALERAQLKMDL